MDVKGYFRRLREKAAELEAGDQVVVSLPTQDGGREGVVSVVPREIACKLLVEMRARLATAEEKEAFELEQMMARDAWERGEAARRIHVEVLNGLEKEARDKSARKG